MNLRRPASMLLVLPALVLALALTGCSKVEAISISPASGTVVLTTIGQTAQYRAIATEQFGSGSPTSSDITTSVAWSVSNPGVATINAAGVATAVSSGHAQINAEYNGMIATSDITVETSSSGSGSGSGGGTPSITVIPGDATETFVGETTQFIASGSLTGVGSAQNLTSQVQWISSNVQVATVNQTGLATAVGAGTTTITAESGGLNSSATLTVATSVASSTPTLELIPGAGGTATFAGETTQFIALGNLSGGTVTQNLTNSVTWYSSDVAVATIDQTGLATAVGANTTPTSTTITAIGATSSGSLITATSTLAVSPTGSAVNLPALAIYMTGTGTGTVSSSPGTVLCGSSAAGASCTGTFTLNTTVTLTAAPATGSIFGGWSANCTPVVGNALQCTIKMANNETVGAIFNP
jgi:trimeric autotransporter adhesin